MMKKEELVIKRFKLLNHDSELTTDLVIGEVYKLQKHWFKTNGILKDSWILNIGNVGKHFSDENVRKYFTCEDEDTDIIGYGRTYK